ncbi:unnamed protein product [Amoebophrya sp. A25]|nr:unnamed protein product [Amoebophrya sp. A25]|eukprot:GSA25T00025767001.1
MDFAWMELPVTIDEFRKVLVEQTDLSLEAKNLNIFRQQFGISDEEATRRTAGASLVTFPRPLAATERVLVEEFVDAKPLSYFIENPQSYNEELARLGMQVLNRMIFLHNFVHADCHSGNLFFKVTDRREELRKERTDLKIEVGSKIRGTRSSVGVKMKHGGVEPAKKMELQEEQDHTRMTSEKTTSAGGSDESHTTKNRSSSFSCLSLFSTMPKPPDDDSSSSSSDTGSWLAVCGSLARNAFQSASIEITDTALDTAQFCIDKAFGLYTGIYRSDENNPLPSIAGSNTTSSCRSTSLSSTALQEDPEKRSLRLFRKKEHRFLDIEMVIFDVGMVTALTQNDRRKFMQLVKGIITRDTEGCAQMLQGLCRVGGEREEKEQQQGSTKSKTTSEEVACSSSTTTCRSHTSDQHAILSSSTSTATTSPTCTTMPTKSFDRRRSRRSILIDHCVQDMRALFTELNRVPLHKVNVGGALRQTLDIISSHRLKVEGHFGALLSSLIILEGMAKELDPNINVMGSTAPFLMNTAVEAFMAGEGEHEQC